MFNNSTLPENVHLQTYALDISDSYINLSKIYGVVGEELNVYADNIAYANSEYIVEFICDYGTSDAEKWTYTPNQAGNFKLEVQILSKTDNTVIQSKSTDIIISNVSTDNVTLKYLAIGDSTTEAGGYTNRILNKFSSITPKITLLGTNGTSPNLHEGRAGWTTTRFRETDSPFYSLSKEDFDFSYYMNKNSYSEVDYVTIHLGINDLFSSKRDNVTIQKVKETKGNINAMISSIKGYDNDIKIGIMVTIPPTSDSSKFTNDYNDTQTLERYLRNNIILADEIIKTYGNRENEKIYIIPTNATIDRSNGLENGVHPNTTGYNQMGDEIFSWIMETM